MSDLEISLDGPGETDVLHTQDDYLSMLQPFIALPCWARSLPR
jgi:hypothetical protein